MLLHICQPEGDATWATRLPAPLAAHSSGRALEIQTMRIALLLITLFLASAASAGEYVAFFGTGVSQEYLPKVEQACPAQSICPDVVYRWTIRIEKVVSGELSGKTVKAAMIQHTRYIHAHRQQALFVLSRIEDDGKRKLVGADYWIEEYVPPRTLYCLPQSGKKYGLEDSERIGQWSDSNCFTRYEEQ